MENEVFRDICDRESDLMDRDKEKSAYERERQDEKDRNFQVEKELH